MKRFYLPFLAITLFALPLLAADKPQETATTQPATLAEAVKGIDAPTWDNVKNQFFSELLQWVKSTREVGGDIYGEAKDVAKGAKGFIVEQAPLVVQEVVRWGIAKNGIYCIGFLVIFVLGCYWHRKGTAISWKAVGDDQNGPGLFILKCRGFITAIVSLFFFGVCFKELCFVYFAPRLYVITQITDLVKSATGHGTP